MIDEASLARTVDSVNDALRDVRALPADVRVEVERWLLPRQITSGRNAGAFRPTDSELAAGIRLYTGERLRTKLAAWNVLTAEAARILILLGSCEPDVVASVSRARGWLDVSCFAARACVSGECAHSSAAYLRLVAAVPGEPVRLARSIAVVRDHRDGAGRWDRFPFYYTLLALTEAPGQAATDELRYAFPACERVRRRGHHDPIVESRRQRVLECALRLVDRRA